MAEPPAQEAFLAAVSHGLRTPLTPIRGYAEILRRHPDLPAEKIASYADTILASTLRLARVIDLVVEISALESGRAVVADRSVGVGSLLDERLANWQGRGGDRAGDLGLDIDAAVGAVMADPVWLAKILDELLDNALRFSTAGSPVLLVAQTRPGGVVRIGVRDSGAGLDPAVADALLGRRAGEGGAGLGVGLLYVRRLAARLHRTLSVTALAGGGTEVALDLPAG
ncbi:MAG: HAMP domain-containing histidine kinase [Actinomycetota bacterium]|nr:HAMP domain-containing histidine kinase [Actinomycetota bacterium]